MCPHKIIDDFGICYSLGVGLGTIINGARGLVGLTQAFIPARRKKRWFQQ
jgi:hypothetical protein